MFNRIVLLSIVFSLEILGSVKDEEDSLKHLQYRDYLREVLEVLEEDPIFVKLLQNSSYEEIISGRLKSLKFLNHDVRTRLDEMKRNEIHRLNTLLARKRKLLRIPDHQIHEHAYLLNQHLDHSNKDFNLKDLENLVTKSKKDLEDVDKKRRVEFQQYEMQKELERRIMLQKMDMNDRKLAEELHKKLIQAHKNHPKINHPGSLAHFKEVWNKEDGLSDEEFDSRTFFKLHDLNDDEFWDEFEIEALFEIELNKLFNDSAAPFDPMEREEEMNRMREHLAHEFDTDHDGVVSIEEYLAIQRARLGDAHVDDGWTSVEDEPQFNEQQFEQYSSEHATDSTTSELVTLIPTETTSTTTISFQTTVVASTIQTETTTETTTLTTTIETTISTVTTTTPETTTTTIATTPETTTTTITTTTASTTTTPATTATILLTTTSSSLFHIKGTVDGAVYWVNCDQNARKCSCGTNEKEASVFKAITIKSGYVQVNLIDNVNYCLNVYSGSQNVNLWLCEPGRNAIFTPALQGSWTKSNAWYDGWFNCLGNGQQLTISEKQNEWQFVEYIK